MRNFSSPDEQTSRSPRRAIGYAQILSQVRSEDDEDGELIPDVERSVVVDRDHPSWAEVNAEQQERIHGSATD